MPRKRKLAWTNKLLKGEGWYWFRNEDRSMVLHIFDPLGNHSMKVWD